MFRRLVNWFPPNLTKTIGSFNLNRVPIVKPFPQKKSVIKQLQYENDTFTVLADSPNSPNNSGSSFAVMFTIAFFFISLAYRSERHRWVTN